MKLSVMMLAYNHERFIAQAIQSVLDQKVNFKYEIVIGEDRSTDRTREIIQDFHLRYPDRIVPLFRNRNLGMMRNATNTLSQCRGEYVAFLEGDDYWATPDKLQKQVDFLDAHPDYAICCGRVRILEETNSGSPALLPAMEAGTYTITDLLRQNFIYTCTNTCRWNLLQHLPKWFEDMKLGDWPLCVLLAQFGKIELMDKVLATYRIHPAGAWSSRSATSRLRETIRMMVALNSELGFRHENMIHETIAKSYRDWAQVAWETGSRTEASACLIDAMRNRAYKIDKLRPLFKGLAWFVLFGSWLPAISKTKRTLFGG